MKTLVVAPSYKWFLEYCENQGIDPRDTDQIAYVSEADKLEGYRHAQLVKIGDWHRNKSTEFMDAVDRFEKYICRPTEQIQELERKR